MATTWKDPVRVATTRDLGSPPGIPGDREIDGVTLATGGHVLVKDQNAPTESGIYVVQAGPPLALARPLGRQLTRALLQKHRVLQPPTPLEAIVQAEGLQVTLRSWGKQSRLDALLFRSHGLIAVNRDNDDLLITKRIY
jgi:hypothetical protein